MANVMKYDTLEDEIVAVIDYYERHAELGEWDRAPNLETRWKALVIRLLWKILIAVKGPMPGSWQWEEERNANRD